MKNIWKLVLLMILYITCNINNTFADQPALKLRYNFPAKVWMTSALPIGNGFFGGMFFGNVTADTLQFNDKSLWTGSTTVRGAYQSFGNLILRFPDHSAYTNYNRELSLDEAIGKVTYTLGAVSYQREYLASNPDSVIVMRITAPGQTAKLNFAISLTDAHKSTPVYSDNTITFKGSGSELYNATSTSSILLYNAQVKVVNEGGTLTTGASQISIANADAVTIILAGGTNFNPATTTYTSGTAASLNTIINNRVNNAAAKTYEALKTSHLNDYQPLFNRVKLDLDITTPDVYTDELIRSYKDNSYLDILYYQYGRYLMLGSSRGMSLPSNLQGLWNNSNSPAWQCDIHSNINVQMNYWPAENANLSECHLPFLDYIKYEALKSGGSWQKMANTALSATSNGEYMAGNYGGWTLRTQSNIFGYSDWNWNRPANAWYCMHLWQHYRYTNDTTFLKEKAFPAMKSACLFWFNRLKAYSANQVFSTYTIPAGTLYAPDEWSPEQGSWENNVAYAQQLVWDLFDNTMKAGKLLNADTTFMKTLTEKFAKLDNGLHIGTWGQIREWTTQADVQGNTHRHLSPLIALYPGNNISIFKDSTYVKAAKVLLTSRGDAGTGWSRAWKIACWARLFDGNHAYKLMKAAQNLTTYTTVSMTDGLGGIYENMLDAHPSYQIDGNFGFTAGVTEMLIQSNQDFINLLPALPSVWPSGSFNGLRAIGNFTVDLSWKNALPVQATVYSGSGDSCKLYFPAIGVSSITDDGGKMINFDRKSANMISFATIKGKTYSVVFSFGNAVQVVITPYISVNGAEKIQTSSVKLKSKDNVTLSPQSTSYQGTWSWTGPNSFTASTREITLTNVTNPKSGNYIVTQNINGVKSVQTFNLIIPMSVKHNILSVGDYYLKKKGTQLYWTNVATTTSTSGGSPSFLTKGSGMLTNAQIFTISLDGGYYKIISKADNRYINEKGSFGTNPYYPNWNTFNIYSDSIYSAIQITQNSAGSAGGNYFWNLNTSNAVVYSTNTLVDESKDLIFEIVPSSISGIKPAHGVLNGIIWTDNNMVHIKTDEPAKMNVYSTTGMLVAELNIHNEQSISLPGGVYVVRLSNQKSESEIKVFVK